MAIRESTRERALRFVQSEKFKTLPTEVQQKIAGQIGEAPPETTGQKIRKLLPQSIGPVPLPGAPQLERGERTLLGNIFERPGAATRAAIQQAPLLGLTGPLAGPVALTGIAGQEAKEAAIRGANIPEEVPRFSELFGEAATAGIPEAASRRKGLLDPTKPLGAGLVAGETFARGVPATALGIAADIATNPADVAALLAGKLPVPGGRTLGQAIVESKPAQAVGRFAQQPLKEIGRKIPVPGRKFLRRGLKQVRVAKGEVPAKIPIEKKISSAITGTKDTLKTQTKVLEKELTKAAGTGSLEFQKKLPGFFRKNSDEYGKRLTSISDDLGRSGRGQITEGQALAMADDTIKASQEAFIEGGAPLEAINKFKAKISTGDPSRPLNFSEVVRDVRNIKKSISGGAQRGTARFTAEDTVAATFESKFGDIVADQVPEFKALQSSYRPVIQTMNKANTVFKPFKGEFETRVGTQFLKRAGAGKLEAGEARLLKSLEEGRGFGKGVGKISRPAKEVGKRIAATEEAGAAKLARLGKRQEKVGGLLARKKAAEQLKKTLIGAAKFGAGALGVALGVKAFRSRGGGGTTVVESGG